jgi:ADP-ribose pyrophosphatase YjhB (NUDIX family)
LCLIDHEGKLLMLSQRHRTGWTFPGGLINRGEDAAQAVVREVEEETGLRVAVGRPFAVVVDPSSRRVDILYWVQVDQATPVQAAGEALLAEWLAPEDVGDVDEPTAQALAEFERFRRGASHEGHQLES